MIRLRVKRGVFGRALDRDELRLRRLAPLAEAAGRDAVGLQHDFVAWCQLHAARGDIDPAADESEQLGEHRAALAAMYPELTGRALADIPFATTSWTAAHTQVRNAHAMAPPDYTWGPTSGDPAAATAAVDALFAALAEWLPRDATTVIDCHHDNLPGYDVFWSYAYLFRYRRLHVLLRGLASD